MYKASAGVTLPTSIIGSLPRPDWYTAMLGSRSFLEAMVNSRYREQYEDAVSCFLRAQEIAGLDICTDGDAHYDEEVGGMSWQSYPLTHMDGFARASAADATYKIGAVAYPRGHILHDFLEARVFPHIVGPVGRGRLQYTAMWKTAQRMTKKPVKFGTILPELIAVSVEDDHYKDPVERTWAFSDALNAGAQRARRCRLPGDPDGGAADPHGAGARQDLRQARRRRPRQDLQQHRQRAARARPRCGATPAGATRRSSASSATCRAISPRSRRSTRSTPMR